MANKTSQHLSAPAEGGPSRRSFLDYLLGSTAVATLGAIVYVRRRPDPAPALFGYHEVFHVLVVAAVGLQYAAVASLVARS